MPRSGWLQAGWVAWVLVLLCNVPGLLQITSVPLRDDPDTAHILGAIRADMSARGLASWFARDWPLGNKFYRPLVALSLAGDSVAWGDWAPGYRFTNWLVALLTALGVYAWLLFFTGQRTLALAAAVVFSLRQGGVAWHLPQGAAVAVGLLILGAAVLRRWGEGDARRIGAWVPPAAGAFLAVWILEWRVNATVISWIAARTASLGTLFAMWCLAGFAAFVRRPRPAVGAATLALACAALASYEQTAMLPLAGAAMLLAIPARSRRSRQVGLLLLTVPLAGYAALRASLFAGGISPYYLLQLRSSVAGPVNDLVSYILPIWLPIREAWLRTSSAGIYCLADTNLWWDVVVVSLWLAAAGALLRRQAPLALSLLLVRTVFYLPAALLHTFPHYYYLPETAACALAVLLVWPSAASAEGPRAGIDGDDRRREITAEACAPRDADSGSCAGRCDALMPGSG